MGDHSKKLTESIIDSADSKKALLSRSDCNQRVRPLVGVAKIVAFFSLAFLCFMVLNHVINAGLRKIETSGFGVSNQVMKGLVNADVVISGSSRALTHYDPRIIREATGFNTYNIGRNGSQTDMQVAFLKAYLAHNAQPALLIHNLDLYSFVTTHELYDPVQYLPYLHEEAIYQGLVKINSEIWKSKFIPVYGYVVEDQRFTWLLGIKGFFGWNPSEDHYFGFMPRHTAWTGEFERFRAMNPGGVRFEIEPEGLRVFEELVALCHQRGIAVLLVYSPVYYKMQELEVNRSEVFARFEEIQKKYGAMLWDYSNSKIARNQNYFYNSQHLNATGAEVFSKEIAQRIARDPFLGKLPKVDVVATK